MPYPFRYLSLATATLLFSLTPLLPVNGKFELVVQAQTTQDRKGGPLIKVRPLPQQLDTSQLREELEKYQQALVIYRKIGDRKGEAETLGQIGNTYFKTGQYRQVEELFRQKLESIRKVDDKESEQLILEVMRRYLEREWGLLAANGSASSREIQERMLWKRDISWQELLEISKLNLFVNREVGDPVSAAKQTNSSLTQSNILHGVGWTYRNLGQYSQALEYLQQALKLQRKLNNQPQQLLLVDLGTVYIDLGQYELALEILQNSLSLKQQVCLCHCNALGKIGFVYKELGQYDKALQYLKQALAISNGDSDRHNILNYLGEVHSQIGKYFSAVEFYEKALEHPPIAGDQNAEGFILNNMGSVHSRMGNYAQAFEAYQKALAIFRELNDHPGERTTLSNIASLLEKQKHPELAIAFYKEAVNVTETIRQGLRELSLQEQQSYTKTVASTYRNLADLLLKQNRVLEAQQVLDLLKLQELGDYIRNVRGNPQTQQGTEFLPQEQQLLTQYNAKLTQVVQLGKELEQLQKIPQTSRTSTQETRKRQLETQQRQDKAEFLNFLSTPEVVALVKQLSNTSGGENLNPKVLTQLQDSLKQINQDAVVLYPLILEDRLELVLVTPFTQPIRRTVAVKREELNRAIVEFRSTLTNPTRNASEPAQKLYNWLIKPLEAALQEANAKTIIYAPDGQLRYIPLAALYDGKQWLVQKYRVNNITALSLTNFNRQPQAMTILAGALTEAATVKIGEKSYNFSALPGAGKEVENLANTVPNTTKLIGRDFNQSETLGKMSGYSVLHLATHAAFVTGKPEDSFIVFGNSDSANFNDVRTWTLKNFDLVVLSACETGIGGKLGNGEEILGFGYLMQEAGARASIASLWTVDDGGTQVFMSALYRALQTAKMTKTEALRQAQIALITGDQKAMGEARSLITVRPSNNQPSAVVTNRLSHPYYWAPFILIGNGL